MIKCKICNLEYKSGNNTFFQFHVKKNHDMTSKEYYDLFFKEDGDEKCKICGKDVVFENFTKGYRIYCSVKCEFEDRELKDRWKKTNLEKYGCENPLGNKEVIEKRKLTNLEKFGCENSLGNEEVRKKAKETMKKLYGVEHITQNKEIIEKIKKTNLERYGVDNATKNKEVIEKRKRSNLEKYGVEHTLQDKEIRDKIEKTNLEKFGFKTPLSNENIKNKIKETNLEKYGFENVLNSPIVRAEIKKQREDNLIRIMNENLPEGYKILEKNIIERTYKFICPEKHIFELPNLNLMNNRRKRNQKICPICNPQEIFKSIFEKEIFEFLTNNINSEILTSNRKILDYNRELDIYIPELKLAFECNGVFWHSEIYKSSFYHLNKTEDCERKGIKLIHIYEDEWKHKQEIVKSRILNLLRKSELKIGARECEIKEVHFNDCKKFLEENHIQGNCISKIRLGLFYNEKLVSLMSFGNLRKNLNQNSKDDNFELLRFCNKLNTNVVGGASKLFNYFIKNHKPERIISYADRSWSSGDLYKNLKFKFIRKTKPNYSYVVGEFRYNRFNFRKDVLVKEGYDINKTEHEIMLERGFYRIYDSGSLLFEFLGR